MGHRGNGHGHYNRKDRSESRSERYDDRREQQGRSTPQRSIMPIGEPVREQGPRLRAEAGTPNQEKYLRALRQNDITVCDGPAGTGKTYLSVGEAVHQLLGKQDGPIKKILLVRPLVEAGEHNGFLPGGIFELEGNSKAGPYMRPVLHAMEKFTRGKEEVKSLFKRGIVEVVPLAYMRGCTFDDTYMILDEAQNTTEAQMKLFFTRLGKNSKIVISGDSSQCDLEIDELNGLDKAMVVFGRGGFTTGKASACQLGKEDIMRSPFLGELIEAWEASDIEEIARLNGQADGSVGKLNGHVNGHHKGLSDGDPKRFAW